MPTEILMPALSPTMEEGKLAKWLVKEGQAIKPGDIIAEIETDKATMEVEAVDEGKVSKLLVAEGTEGVKVNTPIAVLDGDGAARAAPRLGANGAAQPTATADGAERRRGTGQPQARAAAAGPHPARSPRKCRAGDGARHRDRQRRPCARRCATPWPRRCAATRTCS